MLQKCYSKKRCGANCTTLFFYIIFIIVVIIIHIPIIVSHDIIIFVFMSAFFSNFAIKKELIVMYVKIKGASSFIFFSFLKRFLILSLAIILSFTTICKPKDANAGILLTTSIIAGIIAAATGSVWTTTQIIDWFNDKKGMSEDEMEDYFSAEISVDGDGNYIFSDDAKLIINEMLADYDESVTMIYRYPLRPEKVQADVFPSSTTYQMFVDAVQSHPDYFFVLYNYYSNQNVRFYVIKDIQSVVNSDNDLIYANCNLYNSDWTNKFYGYSVTLDFTSSKWLVDKNASGFGNKAVSDFDLIFDDPNDSRDWSQTLSVSSGVLMRSDNVEYPLLQAHWVISSYNGALNCYKSEVDMKKDIGSQFVGCYTDTYTGTPSYNITTSEVNNIVNNYYPSDDSGGGGGSGSDDSGGGSSGGVFDGIISGIASGVGSIIKGIFSIIKDLVDAIADAIVSIAKSITDLTSLLKTDFTDFLSAVFPFLPQEFITIMIAGLTLCLLGIIIKIFRG